MNMDRINGALAHFLVRGGLNRSYSVWHAYELIEVFLQHHPTTQSIFDISDDIAIVMCGFEEFANKRQEDILLQLMDVRRSRNKITWIFYNGNNFPWGRVSSYMSNNKYQTLQMDHTGGSSRVF